MRRHGFFLRARAITITIMIFMIFMILSRMFCSLWERVNRGYL